MNLKTFSNLLCFVGFVGLYSEVSKPIIIMSILAFALQFIKKIPGLILSFVKLIIISFVIYLMWKKFHSFLVTEVGISFMLVMSFLKLSELESHDDFFNMFLILILLEGCVFISNPSLMIFVFGLVKILLYFYFLIKLQKYDLNLLSLRRVLLLALPAIIFAVGLYFTFPRFTQGFIGFNAKDFFSSTGNTNINFLDLKEFVPSDKSVFKVFNYNLKTSTASMYWKTNHLWDFRNNQWRLSNVMFKDKSIAPIKPISNANFYTIKTEPVYVDYVPHADFEAELLPSKYDITYYKDNIYKLRPPSKGPHEFNFINKSSALLASNLETEKGLKLADNFKLKYRQIILGDTKNQLSIEQKLKLVTDFFIAKKYRYSLTPKTYLSIEDFIDNGVDGYCSHFASAFAFLLRTVDVPSRVVIGYQGGNLNSFDNSILIKEKDSHAWVEFVNSKKEWQRIDPTELVSPERIQLGGDGFFNNLNNNNGIVGKFAQFFGNSKYVDQVQDFVNYLESVSSSGLFSLDQLEQKKLLKNKAGIAFSLLLILFVSFFYLFSRYFRLTKVDPVEKRYQSFLSNMKKRGFVKSDHETATEFSSRINVSDSKLKDYVAKETNYYISSMYERKK